MLLCGKRIVLYENMIRFLRAFREVSIKKDLISSYGWLHYGIRASQLMRVFECNSHPHCLNSLRWTESTTLNVHFSKKNIENVYITFPISQRSRSLSLITTRQMTEIWVYAGPFYYRLDCIMVLLSRLLVESWLFQSIQGLRHYQQFWHAVPCLMAVGSAQLSQSFY